MGFRVNNNIAAVNSYRNLSVSDKALSSSLEKLSSGFRINKAADDAAGLVVSEGLRAQTNGMTQAARNAQDGVNVAQTADGALGTATSILQRMRDLAVQAANGGSQDANAQAAANTEFAQLSKELDRIAATTAFGGQKLLNGSYNGQFQIGAFNTVNDRLAVDMGVAVFGPASSGSAATAAKATLDGTLNFAADETGKVLTVTQGTTSVSVTLGNETSVDDLITKLGASSAFNAAFTAGKDGSGKLVVTSKTLGTEAGDVALSGNALTTISGTSTSTSGTDKVYGTATGFTATGLGLNLSSVTNVANARIAIADIDNALKNVSTARATVGALQNRFEHAINSLNVSIENITASESAIRDTDMAKEMSKFTKSQILSQAGTSMLAQANSASQNILSLLRG